MIFLEILYLYDVKAKNKKEFNRTKRRFYYWLNQLLPKKDAWKTKSVVLVPGKHEKALDEFFCSFKGKIIVYKAIIQSIEELE